MSTQDGRPENCTVARWLEKIRRGTISLPRFQRGITWKDSNMIDLLTALLQRRPVGVLLILELDPRNEAPFDPHGLRGAPPVDMSSCSELVLDGQQRLTALWRILTNAFYSYNPPNGTKRSFFAKVTNNGTDLLFDEVLCIKSSAASGREILENSKVAWQKKLIPIHLLGEESTTSVNEIEDWCDMATRQDARSSRDLERQLKKLSISLMSRDISFYALPSDTPRETAINVFIKSNESSVKISRFDIAVATIEQKKQEPLRELIENIDISTDRLTRFFGDDEDARISTIGELALKISCLIADCVPTGKYYISDKVIEVVTGRWDDIVKGLNWTLKFFEEERIWDAKRLPSVVPLRVIPALYQKRPDDNEPDAQGSFDSKVRRYLWLSFVTSRYDHNANTRLYNDYKKFVEGSSPIFDNNDYPIPSMATLTNLDSPMSPPTRKNSLSRAVLAVSLRGGAKDLASDERVRLDNIRKRQYHHLFPRKLLEDENRKRGEINHVLNYALISNVTNNLLKAKPPIEYLKKRLQLNIGINTICRRVESHLIPFDQLNVEDGKNGRYESFLRARGEKINNAIKSLCKGEDWSP